LRAIAGLDAQSEGTIIQAGREISLLPPSERDFGIVFQSYALFPNLSVTANVGYGLKSRGQDRATIEKRVADLLELVGLPNEGRKYPAQLSGGQQQRVALARALAISPGLLLLDEPLSALDARVRVRLRHEIRSLQRRLGIATIMVTHDQEEALTMADRIVVMNAGRIEQVGTPVEIYTKPATPFVADFIGTMNFIAGRVTAPGRVAVAGGELACDTTHFAAGTSVRIGLRPENVRVRDAQAGMPNAVPLEIAGLEFLGNFVRASLRGESGELEFVADLSTQDMRDLQIREGTTITVVLPVDALVLYPEG
jgi:iron(III) transport system ATP-binding protein